MVRHCSGIICVPMEGDRLEELNLPLMAPDNTESMGTAFTVSVDAVDGTDHGISAADRATTIKALLDADIEADTTSRGRATSSRCGTRRVACCGGPGHTEASVDLARLAGLTPAGVLCEVVNEDGTMARMPDLERFAEEHGLLLISIADLIAYRRR